MADLIHYNLTKNLPGTERGAVFAYDKESNVFFSVTNQVELLPKARLDKKWFLLAKKCKTCKKALTLYKKMFCSNKCQRYYKK